MEIMNNKALAVDLDGTLIHTDLIQETLIRYILERPWRIFIVLIWWARGRAYLKKEVAARVKLDVSVLPYNQEVLKWLVEEKKSGRSLYLVSGSDQSLVSAVSEHCGIFADAKGSDGIINCTGSNKADWLEKEFGKNGFDYVGNSTVDLKVWKRSDSAIIVSNSESLGSRLTNVTKRFLVKDSSLKAAFKAIRVHQWVKAFLIFVPLLAAHEIFNYRAVTSALLAFFSFCFMSSSTYILNDLVDIESDRASSKKKLRPFAAGKLSPVYGLAMAVSLFCLSILIAVNISWLFLLLILGYSAGTLTYSLFAKSLVIADIVLLAGFYSLRILAGGVACQIVVSKWLLLFSIFFFLGLACIKRFCELASEGEVKASRRGYQKGDLPLIRVMGICSGFIAVLVVALWANSFEVEVIYKSPHFLWLLCPLLLYWIGRIWIYAERGILHHDPVVFALKDRVSYLVTLMAALIVYVAASMGGFVEILK